MRLATNCSSRMCPQEDALGVGPCLAVIIHHHDSRRLLKSAGHSFNTSSVCSGWICDGGTVEYAGPPSGTAIGLDKLPCCPIVDRGV